MAVLKRSFCDWIFSEVITWKRREIPHNVLSESPLHITHVPVSYILRIDIITRAIKPSKSNSYCKKDNSEIILITWYVSCGH